MVGQGPVNEIVKITHHVPRFDFGGSSNMERRSMAVSLAFAPWEHDPERAETAPQGRTIRHSVAPSRPLAGAALASSLKRIIREVAQELEDE